MKGRILCLDLDGTLLSSKNDVSDFAISQIKRIKGHYRIFLASARMPEGIIYIQKKLGILHEPIICFNGALIFEKGHSIFSKTISLDQVKDIVKIASSYKVDLGIYYENQWFVNRMSPTVKNEILCTKRIPTFKRPSLALDQLKAEDRGVHKLMLMSHKESIDSIERHPGILNHKEVTCHRSGDSILEIIPSATSKLTALKLLLRPQDTLKHVIAIGDNTNDLEMIRQVGYGIAMNNAVKEVKEVAYKIIEDNKADGVAKFIYENL